MKRLLPALLFISTLPALAQTDTTSMQQRVFQLGEVVVSGSKTMDSVNSLSVVRIEKLSRVDVSGALNTLPGISLANVGPRNESVVYVRGFDLRQVPVFIDGVPVYVPYDGYVDMGRFTTFDLFINNPEFSDRLAQHMLLTNDYEKIAYHHNIVANLYFRRVCTIIALHHCGR